MKSTLSEYKTTENQCLETTRRFRKTVNYTQFVANEAKTAKVNWTYKIKWTYNLSSWPLTSKNPVKMAAAALNHRRNKKHCSHSNTGKKSTLNISETKSCFDFTPHTADLVPNQQDSNALMGKCVSSSSSSSSEAETWEQIRWYGVRNTQIHPKLPKLKKKKTISCGISDEKGVYTCTRLQWFRKHKHTLLHKQQDEEDCGQSADWLV